MIDALLVAASLACASCGSGTDDPLILYPNEDAKVYLGYAHASGYRTVGSEGDFSAAAGPKAKDTLTVALGKSITRRAFLTTTLPYARNERDGEARSSFADPSVSGRFTAVMPSIASPWVPQVQLVVGHKTAQARSLHTTETPGSLLDVFGSGFPEWRAGVDVWYGLSALKVGAALAFVFPEERSFDGRSYEPGVGQRGTATVGYSWSGTLKTTGGANREERSAFTIDGEQQARSEQVNNSAFLNQDVMLTPLDTLRVGYSRQAAFGANRNTARTTTVALAYMRAF